MIDSIFLSNVASYDFVGAQLNELKKVNIIYGNNGAGKTTISELLRNPSKYPSCNINWRRSEAPIYVYNRHYVQENFNSNDQIKGIFTLGRDSIEHQRKIDDLTTLISSHQNEIDNLSVRKEESKAQKDDLDKEFRDKCWKIKRDLDDQLGELIRGFRNDKSKFMNECIRSAENLSGEFTSLENLLVRKNSLFNQVTEPIKEYPKINVNDLNKGIEIFRKVIVGKKDIDLADLIEKFQLTDWVRKGYEIIHNHNDDVICPFCQRELPENFISSLDMYFDETYMRQLAELDSVSERLISKGRVIMDELNAILSTPPHFINIEVLKVNLEIIQANQSQNIIAIEQKKKEPSQRIELNDYSSFVEVINNEVQRANLEIEKHNELVKNLTNERVKLRDDVWLFIVELNKGDYKEYKQSVLALEKRINGLERSINSKKEYKQRHKSELIKLQEQTTSVEYSVSEINNILNKYGFDSFRLKSSDKKGYYNIVREDGEDVKDTLSEGEKTFITFLYFYQSLKGSEDRDNYSSQKICVIDDPISSLDSNILFIVSSLIRDLIFAIKQNTSTVQQIFVLTHNVYFHKEISFDKGQKSIGDSGFWIVVKKNKISTIRYFDYNPINTSYELLWNELRNAEDQSPVSIQNVMRRILENYFKYLGGIKLDDLEEKFDHEEKIICRSLISWINDGSHSINEDIYIEQHTDVTTRYLVVFKEIFRIHGHMAHYNMMMKIKDVSEEALEVK